MFFSQSEHRKGEKGEFIHKSPNQLIKTMVTILVRRELIAELREKFELLMIAAKNNFVCSICIENISGFENGGVLATPCGHVFHGDCLKQWFQTRFGDYDWGQFSPRTKKRRMESGPCPMCKKELELDRCIKIFLQAEGGMTQLNSSTATRFSEVEKMLDDTKKELDDAKKKATKAREEVALAMNASFRFEQEAKNNAAETVEAKKTTAEASKNLERANQDLAKAKNETEESKRRLEVVNQALAKAKNEADESKRSLEVVNQALANAKKEADESKRSLNGVNQALKNAKKEAEEGKKNLEAANQALMKAEKDKKNLDVDHPALAEANKNLEGVNQALAESNKKLEAVNQALAEAKNEVEEEQEKCKKAQGDLEKAQKSERVLKKQAADAKKKLKVLNQKHSQLKRQWVTFIERIHRTVESVPSTLENSDSDSDFERIKIPTKGSRRSIRVQNRSRNSVSP